MFLIVHKGDRIEIDTKKNQFQMHSREAVNLQYCRALTKYWWLIELIIDSLVSGNDLESYLPYLVIWNVQL